MQIAVLANVGGCDLKDHIKRMMNYLLSPSLARQYNVTGKKGKQTFGSLLLFEVLCGKVIASYLCLNNCFVICGHKWLYFLDIWTLKVNVTL